MGARRKKVIVIAGTARSGTSWLHDVLTSHYNYRRIFEPLHPDQIPTAAPFAGLCLQAGDEYDELLSYLEAVFQRAAPEAWVRWIHLGIGKDTKWSRKILQFGYNAPKFKFWAQHRVIKFIHANLMLAWIGQHFLYPIVFVIRNPFAVVRSQLNMGRGHNVRNYTDQKAVREFFSNDRLLDYAASRPSITERLAAKWCIENLVAIEHLKQLQAVNVKVVKITFEKLLVDENVNQLLGALDYTKREINTIHRTVTIRERIRSSRRKSTKGGELSKDQVERIAAVLQRFNIASYEALTDTFDGVFG